MYIESRINLCACVDAGHGRTSVNFERIARLMSLRQTYSGVPAQTSVRGVFVVGLKRAGDGRGGGKNKSR